jgi:hypothetical protein
MRCHKPIATMEGSSTSSLRILTASTVPNSHSPSPVICTISNPSNMHKHLISPLHIGDPALRKMRTITTTPPIKTSNEAPVLIINSGPKIKSEPLPATQAPSHGTHTIMNGQTTMSLATLLNSLTQMGLLQTTNGQLTTSLLPTTHVQQSTTTMPVLQRE